MTPHWQSSARSPARRSWLETWAGLHALPLRRRLDAVFLVMLTLMVGGVLLLCTVAVEAADRAGWLNAWTLRPLADERILTNVRDRLASDPMLAAAFHGPENALYSAQAGGAVHRYDPLTGLWRSENPLEGRLLNRDFIELRSGCGADPLSRAASLCPDPTSLWALNQTQGLARRTASGWGVVVGDSSLLGQTGQPLQNEDLTTAAVSADGRWLAVGARQDGVGLYDVREHRWLPSAEASRQLPSLRVSHLVWWRDRFWVGSSLGLASLTPNEDGGRVEAVAGVTGDVIDLDADADGSLFALTRAGCENNITGCQRFVALDTPGGAVRELVVERKLYPELNLVGLSFAQYAGNQLAVAGQRGVYVYDLTRHAWDQVYGGPILATHPLADGSGFYYAFAGGAGLFQGTDQPRWSVGDERIVRLRQGGGGEALALTEKGNVYGLPRNADARLVFTGAGTQLEPERLRTGFAVGTTVVLFGPDGALLHDVARRRFEDVPAGSLPEWLKLPSLKFVSASDRLYAVLPSPTSTAVYTLDGARLADGSYYSGDLRQAQPLIVPAGLPDTGGRAWVWADQGLGLLATDGSVYRVAGSTVERVTGPAVRNLDQARILDVTDEDGGLVAATDSGVRRYSAARREWSDTFRLAGKEIVELARLAGGLLGRTPDNMLAQEGGQGAGQAAGAAILIGDGGFSITDAGATDARLTDTSLFLAGQGRVERYDLAGRNIGERWPLAGADGVLIRALIDGKPLSLTGGQAFLAGAPLDTNTAGAVRSLSTTDRQIVAVRELDGRNYLKLYDIANPANARCFFRTPTTEGATRVTDARGLSSGTGAAAPGADGTVAVATDAGLRFYSAAARSWLRGPENLLPRGGRLYTPGGNHLVLVDDQQAEQRLTIVPISSIRLPDSCSADAVPVPGDTQTVRAVAVDEAGGRVAWLTAQGAILEWTPGQQSPREVVAGTGDSPPLGELRRLYYRQAGAAGTLLATTDLLDRPLWRYDIGLRRWTAVPIRFPGPVSQLLDLNLEPVGDQEMVTARTDSGAVFIGSFGPSDQTVNLGLAFTAGAPGLGAPGAAILDVQEWGAGRWTFLLQDRIRTYDPGRRTWVGEAQLPAADPSLQLGQAIGRAVLTAENGAAWLVGTALGETPPGFARAELRPGEQTAIDASGTVWRRLPDGEVNRCDLSGTAFACRTQIAAPAPIDPNSVLQVFESGPELLLFVTMSGVRGYDPRSFQWIELPPEVASLRGPLTVRQQSTRLLLLGGDTLVTLTNEGGRGYQATSLGGVRELVYDDTGQPWVRLDAGWRFWNGQSFAPPTFGPSGGAGGSGAERLIVQEGRQPLAVGPNGSLYAGRGRLDPDEGRLPDSIPPDSVQALTRLTAGEWWAVTGDRADRLSQRTCADRAPAVCLEVVGTAALPSDFGPAAGQPIVSARITGRDDLELIDASGQMISVQSLGGGQYGAVPGVPSPTAPTGGVADVWPTLRANTAQLPDGRWAYEPVVRFEVDANGALLAARPSSRTRLADRGTLQIDPVNPLDARWFRWDRASSGFVVATPGGPVTIPKSEFVIGDRLLFEVADAVLAERSDLIHVANARGILTYRRPDLLLTEQNTVFQPIALTGPIEGAHGRFTTPAGEVRAGGAQLQPLSGATVLQIGDVTLREEPGRRVTGTLPISGTAASALTDRGFLWDVDRRGLAYENGQLLLQSAAGVHPVNALSGFDAGPAGLGTGAGRLCTEGASAILDGAATGAGLWRRDAGQWAGLPSDPALNRVLLDDPVWSWRMAGGQIGVSLRGDTQAFGAGFGADGFGFTSDRLLAASAHAGRLHVMTAGLFEIADTPDALKGLAGRRLPPSQTDSLEDVRFADGTTGLFRRAGGAVARLDDASGQFQAVTGNADPYTSLQLVNADRLRLTRAGGQLQKELRLDLPAGGVAWVGFSFVQVGAAQRFPFDVVTSVAASGNELYVGTAAGLAVSTGGGGRGAGFGDIQALYALSDPATPALAAVTRIGQPVADPTLMMARSATACIERRVGTSGAAGAGFTPCRDAALLENRLRVQNAFWQWTIDGADRVAGWYRDQAGQLAPAPIQITNGRLPHDTLADATVCDGKVYSLWQAGWLTPHAGAGLGLAPPVGSYPPGELTPRQLLCLARPLNQATSGAAPIPAGLYAQADGGRWLQFSGAGWSPINDAGAQQALEEHRTRPPIFERDRLRLPPYQDGVGFVFEQRALDGRWLPIQWSAGPSGERRLEIDRWSELIQQGGQLWVASQAGLVMLGRDTNGRAILDPDRWVLVREPLAGDRPCAITDLEAADGLIRARCDNNSALVFSTQSGGAQLDGQRDSGLFVALPGADPFAERTLVDAETQGRWRWWVTGRQGGQPGALAGRWFGLGDGQVAAGDPGEELQLAGGRFTFDRLTSVAVARPGVIEVGTDAGWIQAPRSRYHALDLRRPDVRNLDPTAFDAVNTTRVEDRTALCLRATAGGYLRLAEDGTRDNPQACPQHLADDDLWRYEREGVQALLPIRARNGGATRQLRAGRFTDDLVAGPPVTGLVDGRPSYLLPTLAGVLRLDERLVRTGIIGEGFTGLAASGTPAGGVPSALFMLNPTTPAYLGDDGLYRLGEPGAPREPLPLAVPQGARLLAVEDGPFEFMRVRWLAGETRGSSLISRDTPGAGVVGRLPLNASDFRPFTDRRGTLGASSPWLWVTLEPGQVIITRQDTNASQTVALPAGWRTVEPVMVGGAGRHRLALIGNHELLEINLDRIVEELYPP